MIGKYCVELVAAGYCDNQAQSNQFSVQLLPPYPPAALDSFLTQHMYTGHYVEVKVPDFMFMTTDNRYFKLHSTGCVDDSTVRVGTRISLEPDGISQTMLIKAFGDTGCTVSITASDSF